MFRLKTADKYNCMCNSCGKRVKDGKELTEITVYTGDDMHIGRVCGNFCTDCLADLCSSIVKGVANRG